MANGYCKVCGGSATSANDDISSNGEKDRAYCNSSCYYIWTCDRCGTSFHAVQKYPTTFTYYCPNCSSYLVYNQNKGINF